jgi:hypothetical protein
MHGMHEYGWRCQQKYGKVFKVCQLCVAVFAQSCHSRRVILVSVVLGSYRPAIQICIALVMSRTGLLLLFGHLWLCEVLMMAAGLHDWQLLLT